MTGDPVATAARAAAARLEGQHGPGLAADMETALHTRETEQRLERYFDPVSLGSLIVSIASLAWSVYIGLKQKTPNPVPDVLARSVRVELRTSGDAAVTSQNEVTDVVVTEIIRAAGDMSLRLAVQAPAKRL
jgi:hypothetical protein